MSVLPIQGNHPNRKAPPAARQTATRLWAQVSDDAILARLGEHEPGAFPLDPIHSWVDDDTAPDVRAEPPPNVPQPPPQATEQAPRSAPGGHRIRVAADRALWVARGAALAALIGALAIARGSTPFPANPSASGVVAPNRSAISASRSPGGVLTESPSLAPPRETPPPLPAENPAVAPEPPDPGKDFQTSPPGVTSSPAVPRRKTRPQATRGAPSHHRATRERAAPAHHYDESRDEDAVMPLDPGAATTIVSRTVESRPAPAPASPAPKAAIPQSFRAIDLDDPFGHH